MGGNIIVFQTTNHVLNIKNSETKDNFEMINEIIWNEIKVVFIKDIFRSITSWLGVWQCFIHH